MKRLGQLQQCQNTSLNRPSGVAVVAIGNPLRGDDGVAAALCGMIQPDNEEHICRYDLGPFTNLLLDCVKGHAAAVLVDATSNGLKPGTVTTWDLKDSLDGKLPLKLSCSHGFSLLNELQVGRNLGLLPGHVKLFGIEAGECKWGQQISPQLKAKLPELRERLAGLIRQIKKEACDA